MQSSPFFADYRRSLFVSPLWWIRHLRDPTAMYGHEKAVYPKLDRRRADMPFKAHARNDSYREVLFYELTRKSKAQKLMNYWFCEFCWLYYYWKTQIGGDGVKNRAGKTVQNLSGEMVYTSFYPQPLPPQPNIEIDTEMQQPLIDAHKKLALLNGLFRKIRQSACLCLWRVPGYL